MKVPPKFDDLDGMVFDRQLFPESSGGGIVRLDHDTRITVQLSDNSDR